MGRICDLRGQRFGRLIVLKPADKKAGRTAWWCRCDCGNDTVASGNMLKRGDTRSCGCLHAESARRCGALADGSIHRKHGLSQIPEYFVWKTMRQRASGRGPLKDRLYYQHVTCCDRWADFAAFIADMGRRPSPLHSIDRIDNSKSYSSENCRWATPSEQHRNSRPRYSVIPRKDRLRNHPPAGGQPGIIEGAP